MCDGDQNLELLHSAASQYTYIINVLIIKLSLQCYANLKNH